MEHKRIKVRLTKNSPYSDYGYYEKGDIGYIDGYVNSSAVIILENGKFAKSDLRWIEVVNEEDENVNSEPSETDDERIRKSIINLVIKSAQNGGMALHKWESQQMIAWLEKQAQKPVDKVEPKFKVGDLIKYDEDGEVNRVVEITSGGYKLEHGSHILCFSSQDYWELVEDSVSEDERIRKEIIDYLDFYSNKEDRELVDKWIAWLKKQGKKKSTDDLTQQEAMDIAVAKCFDEQKPADKVEPKFKVGDWVVLDNSLCQIEKVTDLPYNHFQYWTTDGHWFGDATEVHLWTIQDAKDGDVLCTYECDEPKIVFILKGIPKKHYALSYHCYYNIMYSHFESDSEKGCLAPNDEDVKPATKEQCDLLFAKMKEAGYEWDAEKKELKKIEQNTDKDLPSFDESQGTPIL